MPLNPRCLSAIFQSTLSMRRATIPQYGERITVAISIHALHEESDFERINKTLDDLISIHALHEESDIDCNQSRTFFTIISIHALHEESDPLLPT